MNGKKTPLLWQVLMTRRLGEERIDNRPLQLAGFGVVWACEIVNSIYLLMS